MWKNYLSTNLLSGMVKIRNNSVTFLIAFQALESATYFWDISTYMINKIVLMW